jgi:predicted transport protein
MASEQQKLISQALKKFDLNQKELALILDVRPWSVGAWISGERKLCLKHKNKIDYILSISERKEMASAMGSYETSRIKGFI